MTTQPDDATRWIDNQGDIWTLGSDGLMHTPETAPFTREHVEKKWGPLKPMTDTIDDGFGNTWVRCSPTCDLQVVRPGKARCSCGDTCPERYEADEPDDQRTHTCALPPDHVEMHRCPRCGIEWAQRVPRPSGRGLT